jgi:hypothetical protein
MYYIDLTFLCPPDFQILASFFRHSSYATSISIFVWWMWAPKQVVLTSLRGFPQSLQAIATAPQIVPAERCYVTYVADKAQLNKQQEPKLVGFWGIWRLWTNNRARRAVSGSDRGLKDWVKPRTAGLTETSKIFVTPERFWTTTKKQSPIRVPEYDDVLPITLGTGW